MTQFSMLPWETQRGIGDGAFSYTQSQSNEFFRDFLAANPTTAGVLSGIDNELAVSGTASPLTVASGKGQCYGRYWSTASENLTVTTPVVGDTGGRVVLRTDWSANTIRLAVKLNTDGNNAIPALTQTAGTTWEIGLASFVINTAGVIYRTSAKVETGVTDTRAFIISPAAGLTKLRTYVGTGASNCVFRDIQSDLTHLVIVAQLLNQAGSTTATNTLIRLNNDTAGNYSWNQQRFNNAGGTILLTQTAQTSINLGVCTSSTSGANLRDNLMVEIPVYAGSGNKGIVSSLGRYGNGSTTMFSYRTDGYWLSTSAINRIDIFADDGGARNWATGTVITLYGRR